MPKSSNDSDTLVGHLEELRYRIIICILSILFFGIISYIFSNKIIEILKKPYPYELVFLTPVEPFMAVMLVSIFGGFIISLPVITYQILKFIFPALAYREKMFIIKFFPLIIFLFIAGLLFSYFVFLPTSLKFLIGFGTNIFKPMISVSSYFSFVIIMSLIFSIIFELPVAVILLRHLRIVDANFFSRNRKTAIIIALILAAVITPGPDVFSQLAVAIPLILLYEISIWIAKVL